MRLAPMGFACSLCVTEWPCQCTESLDRAEARLWPVGHLHESEPPPERAILADLITELRETAAVKPGATGRLLMEMVGSAEARLREVGDE